jgi:hypothetical protein
MDDRDPARPQDNGLNPSGNGLLFAWRLSHNPPGKLCPAIAAAAFARLAPRDDHRNPSLSAQTSFGRRGSRVRDRFGNIWWITATVEKVAPEEAFRRLSEPEYAGALREARESLDRELRWRYDLVGHGMGIRWVGIHARGTLAA